MASTLKKIDIADDLYLKIGLNKTEAAKFLDVLFHEMVKTLEDAEEIGIVGFGKFCLRDKASRPGVNFKTKKPIMIKPKRIVSFKASQLLKKQVESGSEDVL